MPPGARIHREKRRNRQGTTMSTSLMTTRRFAPLFWCQFFSAFGDNFLKTGAGLLILFQVSGADSGALITLAGATLIFPFFFLSGLGGELADRYDKAIGGAAPEAVRDRRRRARGGGLRVPFARPAVPRGVPVRRDRFAVRPDQIRHPARPSRPRRADRPAMRWSRAAPSSPFCSAPSSPAWRPRTAATPFISPG